MSYQKYHWEVVGKDYNSPYFRNHIWTKGMADYERLLDIPSAQLGIVSHDNQISYVGDLNTWSITHEKLKAKVMDDYNILDNLIDTSMRWGENFNAWTEKNIWQVDLSKISNRELKGLLNKFINGQAEGYTYGTALPTLDSQNFSFVENNLNRILSEKVSPDKQSEYYAVFTEPIHNSFAQDQEESLLHLMVRFNNVPGWRQAVQEKEIENIKNDYPDFYTALEEHARQYGWVYYVYMGPAFAINDFYGFVQDYLHKGVDPEAKLEELKAKHEDILKRKDQYLAKLNLIGLDDFILRVAGKIVWAKPRRKDYQSRSYYHSEKLLREIGRRLYISLDQARSLPLDTIRESLDGFGSELRIANDIKKYHACLPNDGEVIDIYGKEVAGFNENYLRVNNVDTKTKTRKFKGTTACGGYAMGAAKIINVPDDMEKMQYGDILVSSGTTPSIVSAMKKAAAIVTDEGGLTCHASIVSREMGIPCVVSLKNISASVRDGDRLKVDANKGTVEVL